MFVDHYCKSCSLSLATPVVLAESLEATGTTDPAVCLSQINQQLADPAKMGRSVGGRPQQQVAWQRQRRRPYYIPPPPLPSLGGRGRLWRRRDGQPRRRLLRPLPSSVSLSLSLSASADPAQSQIRFNPSRVQFRFNEGREEIAQCHFKDKCERDSEEMIGLGPVSRHLSFIVDDLPRGARR